MSIEAGLNLEFVGKEEDAHFIKDILDRHGVKASALGAPVVNTDESHRPDWIADDEVWPIMTYTLNTVLRVAERSLAHLNTVIDAARTAPV